MPIRGLQWASNSGRDFDASRDRHLLRSEVSGSLLDEDNLEYLLEDGDTQSAGTYPFNDVEIEFRPLFRAQKGANRYSGFGIHLDSLTGIVSFDPGPRPANAPHNFLIEAQYARTPAENAAPNSFPHFYSAFMSMNR